MTELGAKADPRTDRIEVDGRPITAERLAYVVLHKPRGVVATMSDPQGRPTVAEHVAKIPYRLYPVGRLDFATSGVLLLTNDGELTHRLLHPREPVPKVYVVKLLGQMSDADIERWRRGVELDDGPTLPAGAKLLRYEADKTWLELTLREGRNQQIRRMGEAVGFQVMRLSRIAFAGIEGQGLRPGQWRALSVDELRGLRQRYGVPRRVRRQTELAALEPTAPSPRRTPKQRPRRRSS